MQAIKTIARTVAPWLKRASTIATIANHGVQAVRAFRKGNYQSAFRHGTHVYRKAFYISRKYHRSGRFYRSHRPRTGHRRFAYSAPYYFR